MALENYKRLLADPVILTALGNDLKTAVIRLLFTLLLSLGLALILTRIHVPGNRFFRSLLFFPTMLSAVVVCTVWMMLYNPSFGILNLLLDVIGVPIPDAGWLGDFRTALYSTIPPAVWCSVGFYMIIFISAIDSIPETLFESAKMDGVSLWVETKDIILPLVRPQINFCAIYVVISSMNGSYLFVKLLTNGGPNSASEVLGTYMTTNAFNYHQFGYATAIGTLILAVTLLISGLLNKIFRSEAYEF
ncbi:MAG: sugar ABC transporter permease [Lachnospiraceae bacterium]|nr:sugar ABC transporter permease [Lachnospiraceae bacterium]